jgi:muramoyltetrapeptide carboxypeptidase LdcA involved in peptidoglycan recycling
MQRLLRIFKDIFYEYLKDFCGFSDIGETLFRFYGKGFCCVDIGTVFAA